MHWIVVGNKLASPRGFAPRFVGSGPTVLLVKRKRNRLPHAGVRTSPLSDMLPKGITQRWASKGQVGRLSGHSPTDTFKSLTTGGNRHGSSGHMVCSERVELSEGWVWANHVCQLHHLHIYKYKQNLLLSVKKSRSHQASHFSFENWKPYQCVLPHRSSSES